MEYLKKILFNNKKLNLIVFLLFNYMDYYRKIEKTIDNLKLKMQITALTLKIAENGNKLEELTKVVYQTKSDINENHNDISNIELLSDENI